MFNVGLICAVFCALSCSARMFKNGEHGEEIRMEIEQGKLVGEWRTSFGGRTYGAFEGIPFAKPPVGERRFKDPEKAEEWDGTRMAKKVSDICLQWLDEYDDAVGSEDCLYVNVYTPLPRNVGMLNLPVIVYIHGGAFIFGTGNTFRPDFLMDNHVVLVTILYRVGVLGFMSTQDSALPGNLGLKDQSMALRWVQDNIHLFGGNPERVTIAGMSAGGASVHLHMLSPMSKGLFEQAISMSGTALCPWVIQEAPLEKARVVGAAMGCETVDTKDMVECLRGKSGAAIVRTITELMMFRHAPFSPWSPVVEADNSVGSFLSSSPYELVRSGKAMDVPWIVSLTSKEGLYPAAMFLQKPEYLALLDSEWDTIMPHLFDFNYTLPLDQHQSATQKLKEFYLEGKNLTMENFDQFVDALSDRHFNIDIEKTREIQSAVGKRSLYFYRFSYRGATSLSDVKSHTNKNYGVSHGDDTGYVLQTAYMNPTTTPEDIEMIGVMTKMWASFARDGLPILPSIESNWDVIGEKDLGYVDIRSPKLQTVESVAHTKPDSLAFWISLGLQENENLIKINVAEKEEL